MVVHILANFKMVISMVQANIYGQMRNIEGNGVILKWMGLELLNGMMEENIWGNINMD